METKTLTGYPSVDKPWLKYYKDTNAVSLDKQKSLYQHFADIVTLKGNEYAFAEQLTNKTMTFSEILESSDRLAAAMVCSGLKSGMVVGLLSFYAAAEPIIIFAANKIGVVLKFISPDFSLNELKESLEGIDLLFIDKFFVEVEPIINPRAIKTVICEADTDKCRENCISFDDFVSSADRYTAAETYDSSEPSMIIYSSGTTGKAKPIVHSNFSILSAIEKMLNSDFPINSDNYILKVIPSYIGLGCITTVLTALLSGTAYISIKPLDFMQPPECVLKIIIGYNDFVREAGLDPNKGLLLFASPIFASVLAMNADKIDDLSFIKGTLFAGAKMDTDTIYRINSALAPKGLNVPLCNGYGQNEMAGAVALNTVGHNVNGSAGYPVYGTEIMIVDEQTHEELSYNKEGLVLERSESLFLYYENMPEKSDSVMLTLPDGSTWFNSTDLGYIDENGFIYITGRTTRVVIRTDHKVSLEYLEEKLRRCSFVKDAAVISAPDNSITAFISLSDRTIENVEEAVKSNADFSFWEIPERVIVLEDIPYMSNGKIDHMALEKKQGEE